MKAGNHVAMRQFDLILVQRKQVPNFRFAAVVLNARLAGHFNPKHFSVVELKAKACHAFIHVLV